MAVLLQKNGKSKIIDWPLFVESLTPAQVSLLWNALEDVIERQDSTVILEIFTALINRWKGLTRGTKKGACDEAEHRFFSEEALERDDESRRRAREIVDDPDSKRIILTDSIGDDGKPN